MSLPKARVRGDRHLPLALGIRQLPVAEIRTSERERDLRRRLRRVHVALPHALELLNSRLQLRDLGGLGRAGFDFAALKQSDRIVKLADLIVTRPLDRHAVAQGQRREFLVRVAAPRVGDDGARVPAESHVGLSEAVVGQREQRVPVNRLLELLGRLFESLRKQELLSRTMMDERFATGSLVR